MLLSHGAGSRGVLLSQGPGSRGALLSMGQGAEARCGATGQERGCASRTFSYSSKRIP